MTKDHSPKAGSAEAKGRELAQDISGSRKADPVGEGKRKVDGTAEAKGRELAAEIPSGVGGRTKDHAKKN